MAKKKKSGDGSGAGLLLLPILAALVLMLTPVALLFLWLFNKSKCSKAGKTIDGTLLSFWLSKDDCKRLVGLWKARDVAKAEYGKADKLGASEGLTRNNDGSFSKRSKRGKELAGIMERAKGQFDESVRLIDHYVRLPLRRWDAWYRAYSKKTAYAWSLAAWVGGLFYSTIAYKSNIGVVQGLKDAIYFPVKLAGETGEDGNWHTLANGSDWYQWAIPFGFALVGFIFGKIVAGITAKSISPKPPVITPDNILAPFEESN